MFAKTHSTGFAEFPFVCKKQPFVCFSTYAVLPFIRKNMPFIRNSLFLRDGFSLVELMMALAIVGILVVIGGPATRHFLESNRLTAVTNDLLTDISLARSEAIKRKAFTGAGVTPGQVVLCVSTTGVNCAAAPNDWQNGWMMFWDQDSNGAPGDPNDTVIKVHNAMPPGITTTTNPTAGVALIVFDSIGAPSSGILNIDVTNTTVNQCRQLRMSAVGQAAIRPTCT